MKRRLFLVTLLACASLGGGLASARQQQQETPPDRVTVEELKQLHAAGKVLVLDVRHQVEKKVKGALHVPLDQLESRLADLPREREVVTYCA